MREGPAPKVKCLLLGGGPLGRNQDSSGRRSRSRKHACRRAPDEPRSSAWPEQEGNGGPDEEKTIDRLRFRKRRLSPSAMTRLRSLGHRPSTRLKSQAAGFERWSRWRSH